MMNRAKIRDKLNELERFQEIEAFLAKEPYGSTYFKIKMWNTPLLEEIPNIFTRKFSLSRRETLVIVRTKIEILEEELRREGIY